MDACCARLKGEEVPDMLLGAADIASHCSFSGTRDVAEAGEKVPFIRVPDLVTGLTFSQSPIRLGAGPDPSGEIALL